MGSQFDIYEAIGCQKAVFDINNSSLELTYVDKYKFYQMFGIYVRERRVALGISAADLAKSTKISPARLTKIEAGTVALKAETIAQIKKALQLSDQRLETMIEVARIGFVDQFLSLSDSSKAES